MRQLKITKSITNRESQSLDKYLQDIGREELITAEEEVELSENLLDKAKGTAKGILKSLAGYPEDVYKDALAKLKANP